MFILSRLRSLVRLEPKEFSRPLPEALADVLNAKMANKILQGKLFMYSNCIILTTVRYAIRDSERTVL